MTLSPLYGRNTGRRWVLAKTAPLGQTIDSHYSTTPLHRFPLQHYSTTALQHYSTTAPQHYSTTALQHYSTTAPQHHSTTALQHHSTTALQFMISIRQAGQVYSRSCIIPWYSNTSRCREESVQIMHDPAHVSWVGSVLYRFVLYRSCTTLISAAEDLDDQASRS